MSLGAQEPPIESGIGAGPLSTAAEARLRDRTVEPLRPPALDDIPAVQEWRRSVHAAWLAGDPAPAERGHHEQLVGGVRCLTTTATRDPVVVYAHGGGFALGSPEVAVPITERLAPAANVVSVDYRLAPEHPHPAPVDDVRVVYEAVRTANPGRDVILAGDSAGANLVVAVTVAVLADGGPVPAALVLLSPHLDWAAPREPGQPLDDVDPSAAAWLSAAHRGERAPDDPEVSPLRADLTGLPATLVQVGGRDSSRGDAVRFARRCRRAGVEVTLDVWDGLWHAWHYHRDLPEADHALTEVVDFVTRDR